MTTKISSAQQSILDAMAQGYVLSSTLHTKYRPFDMPAESGGTLRNPHVSHVPAQRTILISIIKAMLAKGLIAEESRSICSSGTWGKYETETWRITYKLVPRVEVSHE